MPSDNASTPVHSVYCVHSVSLTRHNARISQIEKATSGNDCLKLIMPFLIMRRNRLVLKTEELQEFEERVYPRRGPLRGRPKVSWPRRNPDLT